MIVGRKKFLLLQYIHIFQKLREHDPFCLPTRYAYLFTFLLATLKLFKSEGDLV